MEKYFTERVPDSTDVIYHSNVEADSIKWSLYEQSLNQIDANYPDPNDFWYFNDTMRLYEINDKGISVDQYRQDLTNAFWDTFISNFK